MISLDLLIENSRSTKERLLYTGLKLFSAKGYSNVGIRLLCSSVGIKESSFYNHFKSKEGLFREIMGLMVREGDALLFTEAEIDLIVAENTVDEYMEENLRRIREVFTNPLFMTVIRLVVMESYINPVAYELSENNAYAMVKAETIDVLNKYREKGQVQSCNLPEVVDAYYHGIKTYNDTYILNDAWGKDQDETIKGLAAYNRFYIKLLKGEIYDG